MRALLASPLGFLIGLSLGAVGGGGSILAVPALVYAAGENPKAATASSLFLVGSAALVGMMAHWRAGRVRVATGVVFGLTGIGGSLVGSALNRKLDPNELLLGFSGLIVIAAWRMLAGTPGGEAGDTPVVPDYAGAAGGTFTLVRPRPDIDVTRVVQVLLAGTVVGFLTGLFGVGGGFVIVPALALVLRLPMPEAVGTSLLVIAINSAFALLTRLATTSIHWSFTAPFTVAAVAGVLAGGRVAGRVDAKRTTRWFAGLLFAVAVYTAIRAATGLH